jgi:hypothetical protein
MADLVDSELLASVSKLVALVRRGTRMAGTCPFCRSEGFGVSKHLYNCFSCGRSGTRADFERLIADPANEATILRKQAWMIRKHIAKYGHQFHATRRDQWIAFAVAKEAKAAEIEQSGALAT